MPAKRKKILIVGLGNPGRKYEFTRHNFGFRVVERLREDLGLSEFSYDKGSDSELSETLTDKYELLVAMPQTFMNKSGTAVAALKKTHSLRPASIWVVHDDKDLKLGDIKKKSTGGSAGHKGVQNIMDVIGSQTFKRFRLGIWPTMEPDVPTEKFVLSKFTPDEEPMVRNQIDQAAGAIKEELGL